MKQEIKDKSFTHKCLIIFSKHQNALHVLLSLFFGKLTHYKKFGYFQRLKPLKKVLKSIENTIFDG